MRAGTRPRSISDYDGTPLSVDTGFIVYNEANYPNLTALFAELDVTTHKSDMSFSVSLDHGRLEWSGDNLATVFAQKRNLVRPSFLMMLREILRFNRICLEDRSAGLLQAMSIGDYLNWRGFSPGFTNNYLAPMAAAIWSSPTAKMLEFPAENFIQFFDNHRLIYSKPHPWRTVTGGSRNYLHKLLQPLGDRVHLGCGVRSLRREDGRVIITDTQGVTKVFDKVIIAAPQQPGAGDAIGPDTSRARASVGSALSCQSRHSSPGYRIDAEAPEGLGIVELSALDQTLRIARRCRQLLDEPPSGDRDATPAVRHPQSGARTGWGQGLCRILL